MHIGDIALTRPPPPHDGFHIFVDDADRDRLLLSLDMLGNLPIDRVIVPHGDPILADGAARIRAAVAEARRG